jgi:hypothetical protein
MHNGTAVSLNRIACALERLANATEKGDGKLMYFATIVASVATTIGVVNFDLIRNITLEVIKWVTTQLVK